MAKKPFAPVEIENRRANHQYQLIDKFSAGIQLTGSEIKSVRNGSANISEAYCFFQKGELFIKNMHISEYKYGSDNNHPPRRLRKLLLKKRELNRLQQKVKEQGLTIIPVRMFVNERGFAKVDIALARGRRYFDKRDRIKEKDLKRDMERSSHFH